MLQCGLKTALGGLVVSMLMWPVAAYTQVVNCPPNRMGGTYDEVIVNSGSCTLTGATVRGSVRVNGRASLTTAGGTEIRGNLLVNSRGAITLNAVRVLGDASLKDSGNLSVGAAASIVSVVVERSGTISVTGSSTIESIASKESKGIRLTNARVFPGGVSMEKSTGSLEICESEIGVNTEIGLDTDGGTGGGGVNVVETTGDVLAVKSGSCASSLIDGSVVVAKGTGNVRLVGASLASADLSVSEQRGHVEVGDASLSDVMVANTKDGDVSLRRMTTDSDTTIEYNQSNVTIDSSTLGSDVGIESNRSVTMRNNSFSLEDVLIHKNGGPVVIERNCDLTLSIVENDNVMVTNNNPTDAAAGGAVCTSGLGLIDVQVSKNRSVAIVNNTGEHLKCSDNGSVAGTSNTFTFRDGQCAGF